MSALEAGGGADPYEAARSMLGYPPNALALAERMEAGNREIG